MKIPSPSLIVSTVALVFALGGTGYALTALPKDSVGTTQIKNSAVTKAKIKNSAVTGAKIKNSAVTGAKIKNSAVTGAKIKNSAVTGAKIKNGTIESVDLASGVSVSGAVGATGAAGATGAVGAVGATGATGATGPTASAMARTSSNTTLTAGAAAVEVIRLTTGTTNSGALTLPTTMRVVVSASVWIYKGSAGSDTSYGTALCGIQYAPDGSSSFTSIGAAPGLSFSVAGTLGNPVSVNGTLPVTDAITLAAGTWDFRVQCSATNTSVLGTSSLVVSEVSFTAVATAV